MWPLVIIPALLLSVGLAPACGAPCGTFTVRADRMTFRCASTLLELLAGKIVAEDVSMENLAVEGTMRITAASAGSPRVVMKVSTLEVLGMAIEHFEDLVPLLLGKTVTWEDVKIRARSMAADSMGLERLEVAP